jgi:hypothetical protein
MKMDILQGRYDRLVVELSSVKAENARLKEFDWQNAMIDLTAERDQLKSELSSVKAERDRWKALAKKMAYMLEGIGCQGFKVCQESDYRRHAPYCSEAIAKKAIALFQSTKEEKA